MKISLPFFCALFTERTGWYTVRVNLYPVNKQERLIFVMKRLLTLLLALMLLPLYALAEEPAAESAVTHVMEKKTYPHLYVYDDKDEVTEEEMNLYFADGGDIPYVALSEYVPLISRLASRIREAEIPLKLNYYEATGIFSVDRADNRSSMVINPNANVIAFTNYNSFLQAPGSSALVDVLGLPDVRKNELDLTRIFSLIVEKQSELAGLTEEEQKKVMTEMVGGYLMQEPEKENSFFANTRLINRTGDPVSISLGDYDMEIIRDGEECYLPFQVLNNLLASPMYIHYIFTGEKIIGDVYKGQLTEQAYGTEPTPISNEFAMYNFQELRLFLDTFYGLKPEHRITSFASFLMFNTPLSPALMGTDSKAFDNALSDLLITYLDDSHSGMVRNSWRNFVPNAGPDLSVLNTLFSSLGYTTGARMKISSRMSKASKKFYPDEIPQYEEVGDTAFITFNSFSASRNAEEYYNLENPDDPQDTVELILYAHRQITREGSPVKNIVIDLSQNGGGSVDAAVAVAAWFTGECILQLRDTMTGAETVEGFRADINLNNKIVNDPGDNVAGGAYNLYCLTSPVSFSCGNLIPAIFKQSGIVTLIGQCTGGGSNAVLPAATASGTLFQISGPKQISTSINGSFYNVDTGIDPDVILTRPESFYDRPALVEMINNLK